MKKIRYIPYGYTMRNGRTVIAQDEAAVIREIFSAYINGASFQSIAELLTERKIPYSERTDVWDKARIARIIGNAKYIGDGEYAPIIVHQMIKCVKVYPDGRLDIIFGGGYLIEEHLEEEIQQLQI